MTFKSGSGSRSCLSVGVGLRLEAFELDRVFGILGAQ